MDKRKRLIELINGEDEKDNIITIYTSTDDKRNRKLDPTFCEYSILRDKLGKDKLSVIFVGDGAYIDDEGERAEKNRAYWRKYIEEHKDEVENDIFSDLIW